MNRAHLNQPFGTYLLWVAALIAAPAWGQASASISGRVEDASGSPIGGPAVTVKSLETGASRTAATSADGHYRVLSLPLGPQEVKAEKPGFKADRKSTRLNSSHLGI